MLKPHFESLVQTYVFPQLCFTPLKLEVWNSDPVEYVRISVGKSNDPEVSIAS